MELPAFKEQNLKYSLGLEAEAQKLQAEGDALKVASCLIQTCALLNGETVKDKVKLRKGIILASAILGVGTAKDVLLAKLPKAIQKRMREAVQMK